MSEELFELALAGGAAEDRYRALRPEIEAIDWDGLVPKGASEAQLAAARQQWTAGALQEYATAATHAVTLNLMLRARVPLDLSGMFSRFLLDEIAHAELCARVAGALGGGAPVRYAPEQVFPDPGDIEDPRLECTLRIVRDCCVSETIAHALLRAGARAATDPVLRQVHRTIAKDEAVHGRFGWIFLEWASEGLTERGWREVARAANEEIARHRSLWKVLAAEGAAFSKWSVCGSLGVERYLREGEAAIAKQVSPGLARYGLADIG